MKEEKKEPQPSTVLAHMEELSCLLFQILLSPAAILPTSRFLQLAVRRKSQKHVIINS